MSLPPKSHNPLGFHKKYNITKVDGTPVDPDAIYLVLRLDGKDGPRIQSARAGARAYADELLRSNAGLDQVAYDIIERLDMLDGLTPLAQAAVQIAQHFADNPTILTEIERRLKTEESVEWEDDK